MSSTFGKEATRQLTNSEMDTDSDSEPTDQPYTTSPAEDGEVSDVEQDQATPEQVLSEEQTYQETMHSISSFMG